MQFHKVANVFPMMAADEYAELKADIQANGLIEPIWIYEGQIIDGRNRYNACVELGIEPKFRQWNGQGSLIAFVMALNLKRRHLNASQRAALAVELLPMLEEEAKERMRAGGIARQKGSQIIDTPKEEQGRAAKKAASASNTNRQYISDAKKLKEEAPDLLEKVAKGDITIPQAKRELTNRTLQDTIDTLESNKANKKYRVLYADPPWKYGDSGIINDDNYGRAERHYPTLTIEALCAMGDIIAEMAEDNAVLFMWVTSPILPECFEVIKAWGFKYKASFVWDKVKHNFGHYNSVRHEFLLVCTRGSCLPDNLTPMPDSVQSIEKSTTHSQKPNEFRQLIDRLYQHGNRIELFARDAVSGWDTWGNQ